MWTTFISGSVGSLACSGFSEARPYFTGEGAKILFPLAMIGFAGVSGGLSAQATGGDFWGGFVTAATVAACNHAMHWAGREIRETIDGGDDKNVTFGEARARFRSKTGGKMYQDLRKLGIKNLHISEFDPVTKKAKINMVNPASKHFNAKAGIVHGTITLELTNNGTARVAMDIEAGNIRGGLYNFGFEGGFIKDVANILGLIVNGLTWIPGPDGPITTIEGKPFPIEYSGEIPVTQ